MKRLFLALVIVLCFASFLFAQTDYIELMRKNVAAEKTAIITDAMNFTEEESEIFWPIYREYDFERDKIDDQRIALIKDYAANFEVITDEKADEISKRSFKNREQALKLEKKYYEKMAKALSPRTASRFFQLDAQINSLISLQVSSELPLIEH